MNPLATLSPRELRIPIVVGASGHRDLRPEDVEPLKAKIRSVLQTLQNDHLHSGLIILSALAEGADRLVATVGLALPQPAGLVIPLPMPVKEYLQDFATEESRQEFMTLLRGASHS